LHFSVHLVHDERREIRVAISSPTIA
jgi:hypothetical protein